jgi:hypothetical protein
VEALVAADIKVLTWNVQNLGPLKSGLLHGNFDIIGALAKVVVSSEADIFCLIELNTLSRSKAQSICDIFIDKLNYISRKEGIGDYYKVCLLSPLSGLEFYVFFVKDHTATIPYKVSGPLQEKKPPTQIGGNMGVSIDDVEFTKIEDPGIYLDAAPLLAPDLLSRENARYPVHFPGPRKPAVALFEVKNAEPGNALLSIVACHLRPSFASALGQLQTLPYCSLLQRLTPLSTTPVNLRLTDGRSTITEQLHTALIVGDFNIDYVSESGSYEYITNNFCINTETKVYSLNATPMVIDPNTHLVSLQVYNDNKMEFKTTKSLAINLYDNAFIINGPGSPFNSVGELIWVLNVPEAILTRLVKLSDSVEYYRSLDMKGFDSGDYLPLVKDFARQLNGDDSHIIAIPAALVGARLVSDHEPFVMRLTV